MKDMEKECVTVIYSIEWLEERGPINFNEWPQRVAAFERECAGAIASYWPGVLVGFRVSDVPGATVSGSQRAEDAPRFGLVVQGIRDVGEWWDCPYEAFFRT